MATVALALEILGIVETGLQLLDTFQNQFPSQSSGENSDVTSTVRVGIGMGTQAGDPGNMGGNPPTIALYDDNGEALGHEMGDASAVIDAGGFGDIRVSQGSKTVSPTYIAIEAGGNNAICIAYIALTDPAQNYQAWTGDYGYECGMVWYYSDTRFGGDNHQPRCGWVDGDNTNNINTQAIGMHIPDFNYNQKGLAQQMINNTSTMCNSLPRFGRYSAWDVGKNTLPVFSPPLQYKSDGSDANLDALWTAGNLNGGTLGTVVPASSSEITKRNTNSTESRQTHQDTIVITNLSAHNVTELCTHPRSRGPSIVNTLEGFFCDMASGTLWPICSETTSCGCLDMGPVTQSSNLTTSVSGLGHLGHLGHHKNDTTENITIPGNTTKPQDSTTLSVPFMRKPCNLRHRTANKDDAAEVPHLSFKKTLNWSR